MKIAFILGLCFLTLMIGSSTSEYSLNPYYSRTFGLFNLLQPQKVTISAFNSLTARVTALESSLQTLRNDFNSFRTSVNREIQSLKDEIARLTPKCPAGALLVNGVCLSVEGSEENPSTLKLYSDAETLCTLKGGFLAEPSATDTAFWTNLKKIFPSQVARLQNKGMYVGIKAPKTASGDPSTYSYATTGGTILNSALVWVGTVTVLGNGAAYALVPLGNNVSTKWLNPATASSGDFLVVGPTTRGYICQYPSFI